VQAEGDLIRFTFEDPFHPVMRVTEQEPPRRVAWSFESGHEPWTGSTFIFNLEERDGATTVLFRMAYGRELPDEQYGVYNFNWAYYLDSLRLLVTEGKGKPFEPAD
jgi:Activator of Hsp90 ATPase homolog 1-like protein